MKATQEQWTAICQRLGADAHAANAFELLERAYAGRAYHSLEHIGWGLKRIDEMAADDRTRGGKHDEREWDLIRWAFWFHDFVQTGSPDDELAGAVEALGCSRDAGLPTTFGEDAYRLVMATAHTRIPLRHDEAIICDADLSILGAPDEAFWEYEGRIREEWAHVPEELFKTARAVILERFVDRPWIYMTDYGRTRWERTARVNLAMSLAKLGRGDR